MQRYWIDQARCLVDARKGQSAEAFMKISRGLRNSRSFCESEGGSRGGFVHHFCMILQVHFPCQGSFAPRMGTCDGLMIRMVAEVADVNIEGV